MSAAPATLQRRSSFTSTAAAVPAEDAGLPLHYSGSKELRSRREKRLLLSTAVLLLLLLAGAAGLLRLLIHHRAARAHLVAHAEGWSETYVQLINSRAEAAQAADRGAAQAAAHAAELAGASRAVDDFRGALRESETALAALLAERAAMQTQVLELGAEAEKAKALGGAEKGLRRELEAAKEEAGLLRDALQRCFRDYSTAVEALQALQASGRAEAEAAEAAAEAAGAEKTSKVKSAADKAAAAAAAASRARGADRTA